MTSRAESRARVSRGHATIGQRARARLVALGAAILGRLPDPLLHRLAWPIGSAWYLAAPDRAARARRNLGRVVGWCAANGVGDEAVRAAATDPRALERFVRDAFRHHVRYYVEVTRTPRMDRRFLRERLLVETPEVIAEAFAGDHRLIFVGLHFGAIELPALFLAERTERQAVAPMETIGDPALQDWIVRTRASVGIRIVGLREARRELAAALGRGEPVGLVADRDLTGGGVPTPFFGAPAPIPAGPALLAIETGARLYVTSVRRSGPGRYRGRLERIDVPPDGGRRERVEAVIRAEARAFERTIALAPAQWWGCFFRIWPDLEPAAGGPAAGGGTIDP